MDSDDTKVNDTAAGYIDRIARVCDDRKPLVAIRCITYNHEPYLRDTLEGFLMQQTDFPFVAIVHEDVSTDHTAEILREYAEMYPGVILPIFEKNNQYSKGTLDKIMNTACEATGAKYIATCEGDEYWTDSDKVQKQVDFLVANPEHSMVFHPAFVKFEEGVPYDDYFDKSFNNLYQRDYSLDEILSEFIVPTCSAVCRQAVFDRYSPDPDYFVGDNVIWTASAALGKIYCIAEKMSTYRIQDGGWVKRHYKTMKIRVSSYGKWLRHYQALRRNFPEVDCKMIFNIEIKYTAAITFTDIMPPSKILHNFHRFSILYGKVYKKTVFRNFREMVYYKIKKLVSRH